jgi:hypothetical protein
VIMVGYSSTPLVKKLGIKPGVKALIINEPENYFDWINPLPDGTKFIKKTPSGEVDFIHLFVTDFKDYSKRFKDNRKILKKDGMMWISWPKKSSGVATDLDENVIRDFGLKNGLVDVKVCAVDETWSGLKFVFRLTDRK